MRAVTGPVCGWIDGSKQSGPRVPNRTYPCAMQGIFKDTAPLRIAGEDGGGAVTVDVVPVTAVEP